MTNPRSTISSSAAGTSPGGGAPATSARTTTTTTTSAWIRIRSAVARFLVDDANGHGSHRVDTRGRFRPRRRRLARLGKRREGNARPPAGGAAADERIGVQRHAGRRPRRGQRHRRVGGVRVGSRRTRSRPRRIQRDVPARGEGQPGGYWSPPDGRHGGPGVATGVGVTPRAEGRRLRQKGRSFIVVRPAGLAGLVRRAAAAPATAPGRLERSSPVPAAPSAVSSSSPARKRR